MANSYTQETGSLNLKQITPVIRALYGVFDVQEYEENNAYIKKDDGSITYEDVMEHIAGVMELENDKDTFELLVLEMADKLGKRAEVEAFLGDGEVEMEDDADLGYLFNLAQLMDDGHGLVSYWMEGACTCDKMRQGEFGGFGEFAGKNFSMASGSSTSQYIGNVVNDAINDNDLDKAAECIADFFSGRLNGIRDEATRKNVTALVIEKLKAKA